jgi:hypothetical protein
LPDTERGHLDPTFEDKVRTEAGPSAGFVQFTHIDELEILTIKRGIVFYHGTWSGPSLFALRALCARHAELNSLDDIYILDADDYYKLTKEQEDKLTTLFGEHIGSWGETCWIVEGVIVDRIALAKKADPRIVVEKKMR